jgi:MFS family permease
MKNFLNFSVLRKNRNFRLLYAGQFISFVGTMITGVAVPYQVYQETHSTLMVGLISLFQLLPLLFTSLLGGALADRHHRRKILLLAECILALGSLVLAVNAWLVHSSLWCIFLVASLMSAFYGLHRPALDGIVQQIVDKKDFGVVASLSSFMFSVSLIAGPALAGLLIAHLGVFVTFLIDFASYAVSLIMILMVANVSKPAEAPTRSAWSSLTEGFRYAISRQELIGSYVTDFVAMIFGMPMALFPAIAHLHGGPKTLGLLYSTTAVGSLLASLYSGWTNHFKRQGVAISVAAGIWGVGIILFGLLLKINFWAALFFLAVAGGADAVSGIFRSTLWNQTIPTELRGRLSGIEMLSYLSGPKLGDAEAGLVAAAFGVITSIVSGGILCVVGVGLCCYFFPKFWRYREKL